MASSSYFWKSTIITENYDDIQIIHINNKSNKLSLCRNRSTSNNNNSNNNNSNNIINNNNNNNNSSEILAENRKNTIEVLPLEHVIIQKTADVDVENIINPSFIHILPSGGAGLHIVCTILSMLDIKSLSSLIYSSFIQSFCKNRKDNTLYQLCKDIQYPYKLQLAEELKNKYKKEFRRGTPLVCACQHGRFDDVKLLITGHDVNSSYMTLKEMVSQVGKNSRGGEYTPLIVASYQEHFQIVHYLIEHGKVDPNITNSDGLNALHAAARNNKKNTDLIDLLLNHMRIDCINKKATKEYGECTPLDCAYINNDSPIRQEIIALLRSRGGKGNWHDENGRKVGGGNGDLNGTERGVIVTATDIAIVHDALAKIDDINKLNYYHQTLVDAIYEHNTSSIQQEIIDLLHSKGGKANCHDENGKRTVRRRKNDDDDDDDAQEEESDSSVSDDDDY